MSKRAVSTKLHIKSSFRDAIYTNLNIGMTESYFSAFMLALGFSEVTAGLGTVVPQFIGVIFQLLSIRSFFTQYSLKRRILLFLTLQSLSLFPLIGAGIFKWNSPVLIFAILGIYWASLLSLNPPWNRLIGHTVPPPFRIKFFSIRSQFAQFSIFIGLITSGTVLYWAKYEAMELPIFVVIFIAGLFLKFSSIYEIKFNHNDYDLAPGAEKRVRLRDFITGLRGTDQSKLIVFLFFFHITVHFSAPYFNPYMLGKLKFNYLEFMTITSLSYFGRMFMFVFLQNKAKSKQIDKILLFATVGIATTPLLWTLYQGFWWIGLIEFLSGCYWASFELSTILLYYQKIRDEERTSIITYITLLNTSGMLIGSILGALFLKNLPSSLDQYLVLFATSTFLRFILVIFVPNTNFRGQIPKLIGFNRIISIIPALGEFLRPFLERMKKK